ncbi:MAG: GHKL domain-containing protein [Bacteroidales bacterium]|nr:GHKL domain-containing protein [Bacteroidales bacterium]
MKRRLNEIAAYVAEIVSELCRFANKYRTTIACMATAFLFLISFLITPTRDTVEHDAVKLKRKIHYRQSLLEEYTKKALECPVDEWLNLEEFPDDMVIYKYNADTLQSWVNQFPIHNDDVDVLPLWHRLNYLNSKSLHSTPLAYLTEKEQYVNLGSAWYIVKVYKQERVKVISGLLVKTEYLSDNAVLVSKLNPYFDIDRKLALSPFNIDEGWIIKGKDGGVLFSVLDEVSSAVGSSNTQLKWLSFLFAFLALYSYFYNRRTFTAFFIYILGITVLRCITFIYGEMLRMDAPLFSPNLYADTGLFSSLGNLLLNNLYVSFVLIAIYVIRKRIIRALGRKYRTAAIIVLPLFVAGVALYINDTLHSLINNSNIVLELYQIERLSRYSILCYFSYGFLFISLLLLLQMVVIFSPLSGKISLLKPKYMLGYIFVVASYMLLVICSQGYKKEIERCMMWTNKLSVERDLGLELQLKEIEGKLLTDPIVRTILMAHQQGADTRSMLKNRLNELYLQNISQKYEIQLTICRPNETLMHNDGKRLVDCNAYFNNEVMSAGAPLSDRYNFFFLNNYNGRVSYLGVFTYYSPMGPIMLYLELDSRFMKDVIGYPALLFDYKQSDNINMPSIYSYAKYIDNELIIYRGNYNFPIHIQSEGMPDGFSTTKKGHYTLFTNKFSPDSIIVISRPKRDLFVYFISFSYLMLFFGAMCFLFVKMRTILKRSIRVNLPRHSFRRKITILVASALAISLLLMGLGSVWFGISYYNGANRLQMEEKLQTVQSTLSDFCKYLNQYNELNTSDLFQTIDRMANNTQVDINIYDPLGRLIRSTQPELFERYLLSSRMNHEAYRQIVIENKRQVVNKEQIAELSYFSLYAPIVNSNGKLIAIVNIPYFVRTTEFGGDISSIVAAIINIYILLLIGAILCGIWVSNSLSRPLAVISRKLYTVDVSRHAEHINYNHNDELGILVGAYNKMVDDLEESTKRLAQTEREQAWSEMARQIAHEIKNPLTPMRLSIQHLVRLKQRNVPGWEEKFEEVAGSILEQIDILSETASEFSSFAKFYYEENGVLNLYNIIAEQKILFDTRENVKILFNYCSEEACVYARKGQIIRVLVNLISNAVQAVESVGRGYIRISLLQEDGYFVVSIEDNGPGVKEENEKKLFTPNFTTKSSGTGLGLAICRNIMEQSGGTISYSRSELGGANFSFRLPAY